jgi:transposase
MEATGNSRWFELLVEKLGHSLWIGDAAKIRASYVRKQKTDKRDAAHILKLLVEDRFPRLWLPDAQQRDMRQLLTHRHKLVGVRTRLKTELQHLALNQGVQKKRKLWNEQGRALLASLPLQGWTQQRRKDLLELLGVVEPQIEQLDKAVEQAAEADPQAVLLMSQPGVGPITALAFSVTIGDVSRFERSKQVSSYLGLIPTEHSSGSKRRLGSIAGGGRPVRGASRSRLSQRVSTPLPPQAKSGRQGGSSTQISRTALLDAEIQQVVHRACSQRGQPASSRGGES